MSKRRSSTASSWWDHPVARRTVLKGMGAAGAITLIGKASAINEVLPAYGTEQVLTTADSEGMLKVTVKNGMILRVESLDAPKMEASPMALNWHHRQYAPDRILYPMVRADWAPGGGGDRTTRGQPNYRRVSWDEALDLVASEIKRVKDTYGNEGLLAQRIAGWFTAGSFNLQTLQNRFYSLIGGWTRLLGNKSYACWSWSAPHHIGMGYPTHSMKDVLENGKLVIFWGTDPVNTTHTADGNGQQAKWIHALRRRGVKIITIDPLQTETAQISDQWIAPRPGSDGAIMAAIAHVMITQDLYDKAFIEKYTVGFEPFRQYVMGESDGQPKTPAWAATISDLPEETIQALAMEFATTKGVMLAPGFGIQRQEFGEHVGVMLPIALASMKGELGMPGGGLAVYVYGGHGRPVAIGRGPGRISTTANPVTQTILEQHMAPSILNAPVTYNHAGNQYTYPEPGKSEVKLAHWLGGGTPNQHDDINQSLKAFQKFETIIVQASWWETGARLADIVLPAATLFERNDLYKTGEYAVYQHKIVEPVGEARTDFEIFKALADRFGIKDAYIDGKETEDDWLRSLYAASEIPMTYEEFRDAGYYVFPTQDVPDIPASPFDAFRADPAVSPLSTPSGKIEISSMVVDGFGYEDCPGTPQWIEPDEWLGSPKTAEYPLHMITKHPQWRRHSSYDNVDTLRDMAKINGFEPVTINPVDAAARGIVTGDVVRVFNGRGQALCAANVTDAVRPHVVILQQGSWYRPAEPGTIGSVDRGGCANMLTRQEGSSQLALSPVAHSNLVQIEKYEGEAVPNDYAPVEPMM